MLPPLRLPSPRELSPYRDGQQALNTILRYDERRLLEHHPCVHMPAEHSLAVKESVTFFLAGRSLLVRSCPTTHTRWISGYLAGDTGKKEALCWALRSKWGEKVSWDDADLVADLACFVAFEEADQPLEH